MAKKIFCSECLKKEPVPRRTILLAARPTAEFCPPIEIDCDRCGNTIVYYSAQKTMEKNTFEIWEEQGYPVSL